MAHYKFAAGCPSDNVDQFTKFIGIVATTDCIATPPLHRGNVAYVIRRHTTPQISAVTDHSTSVCGVHITMDDI
jgi:hypothetical protein